MCSAFCSRAHGASCASDTGKPHVVTIWGPFCLIYGIGAVMFYISGEIVRSTGFRGVLARFFLISVVATVFELACGLLLEYGMGMKAWDYSKSFLNYKGLICLKMTVLWGVGGVIFAYLVIPKLKKYLRGCRAQAGESPAPRCRYS